MSDIVKIQLSILVWQSCYSGSMIHLFSQVMEWGLVAQSLASEPERISQLPLGTRGDLEALEKVRGYHLGAGNTSLEDTCCPKPVFPRSCFWQLQESTGLDNPGKKDSHSKNKLGEAKNAAASLQLRKEATKRDWLSRGRRRGERSVTLSLWGGQRSTDVAMWPSPPF